MNKQAYIYFMANQANIVLYLGVTTNLVRRVIEHKTKTYKGFTDKYNCNKLVYYEVSESVSDAIHREKQLKNWKREWKDSLVNQINPKWKDLSEEIGIDDALIADIESENSE